MWRKGVGPFVLITGELVCPCLPKKKLSLPKQAALNSRGLALDTYQWLGTVCGNVLSGWFRASRLCFVFAQHKNAIECQSHRCCGLLVIWCNSCWRELTHSATEVVSIELWKAAKTLDLKTTSGNNSDLIYHPIAQRNMFYFCLFFQAWQRQNKATSWW